MKRARMMLVTSMVIFGTIGLFKKAIPITSGELALYRAILAMALLLGVMLVTRQRIPLKKLGRQLPLLLLSGAAMGVNWILLFESFNHSVALGTLSYYFAPVIVTAACPLLFREKLTLPQIICFAVSTAGLAIITCASGMDAGSSYLLAVLFGLGAAAFYASVILLNKFITGVEGLHRTILQFASAIVTLIPYVALTSGVTLGGMDALGWVCLLILGFVHTGLAYVMYFPSIKALPGQKAAILSYIDPLVAVIISVLVLREPMSGWQWLGGGMILGATLCNELFLAKKTKKP